MNIIGIIPARYKSSRFQGKPLADILGKPMVWWVHKQLKSVKNISEVYIATDDERIAKACEKYQMKYIMTSENHPTHLDRLGEVAKKLDADFYININGDEPLIESSYIEKLIPDEDINPNKFYASNAMTILTDPIDAIDTSKIKIATDIYGNGLYMARSPIPFPKNFSKYNLKKFVGIQCFSKEALLFCAETKRGEIENIEDIDEFRFLENGKKLKFVMVPADTLSVDTPKDLEKVISILKKRLECDRSINE